MTNLILKLASSFSNFNLRPFFLHLTGHFWVHGTYNHHHINPPPKQPDRQDTAQCAFFFGVATASATFEGIAAAEANAMAAQP